MADDRSRHHLSALLRVLRGRPHEPQAPALRSRETALLNEDHMTTQTPFIRNPMQDALDNWEALQADNMRLNEEVKNFTSDNAHLVAEVNMLRAELDKTTREREVYRRYSENLTTRLAVVQECITNVMAESRSFATKPVVPAHQEQLTPEDQARLDRITGADRRTTIPQNKLD